MKEANYYERKENQYVLCTLCPHFCTIETEAYGRCGVRQNIEGKLYTLNYGEISAINLDPIEKKPLKHFMPGRDILSIGSFGCNLNCSFCQNWSIAKRRPRTIKFTPEGLFEEVKAVKNNIGLAYTYNEPTVYYEFMLEMAKCVHDAGYKNVMVSNGFINPEPLDSLLPYMDAFNIDLKAFSDDFYKSICSGQRLPVMKTIERIVGVRHLEITLLLIDGYNTNNLELEALFKWLADMDKEIPLHISRYFPAYKMKEAPTSIKTLFKAKETAERYLKNVYLGNMPMND